MKTRACRAPLNPNETVMRDHDGSGHRQPQPHAVFLGGKERIERMLELLLGHFGPAVGDSDFEAVMGDSVGADMQPPGSPRNLRHGLYGIDNERD